MMASSTVKSADPVAPITVVFSLKSDSSCKLAMHVYATSFCIDDILSSLCDNDDKLQGNRRKVFDAIFKRPTMIVVEKRVIIGHSVIDTNDVVNGKVDIIVLDETKAQCNGCGECCRLGGDRAYGTPVSKQYRPGTGKNQGTPSYGCANLYFDTVVGMYRCASHDKKSTTCTSYRCKMMDTGKAWMDAHDPAVNVSNMPFHVKCTSCKNAGHECTSCHFLVERAEWFVAFARKNHPLKPEHVLIGNHIRASLDIFVKGHDRRVNVARVCSVDEAIRDIIARESFPEPSR